MKLSILVLACLFGLLCTPTAARAEGDRLKGRDIAFKHCARCHVVGDQNRFGGIDSTPSFEWLANRRPDYLERVQSFYERRPHPAFIRVEGVPTWTELPAYATEITITVRDVDGLVAYFKTLRKK